MAELAIPGIPERIAVVYHPNLPDAVIEAKSVTAFLRSRGVPQLVCDSLYNPDLLRQVEEGRFDLLVALGGDGTMLRAGRICAPSGLPILGINAGHFGFLTELNRCCWQESLPMLLQGRYRLEHRMMLHAEHWRGDQSLGHWDVLNEVVVCRGQTVRPVKLRALVDGYTLATFVADGLIASTPTGSTAYALAVGGPIMPPELRNVLIIPVAPHLSMDRAIILPEGVQIEIEVQAGTEQDAVMSVDGQSPIVVLPGDRVRGYAGDHTVSFVRFQDPSYFYRNLTRYMEQNPTVKGDE